MNDLLHSTSEYFLVDAATEDIMTQNQLWLKCSKVKTTTECHFKYSSSLYMM